MATGGDGVSGWVKTAKQGETGLLFCGGDWRLPALAELDRVLLDGLARLGGKPPPQVRVVLDKLGELDTAGAWLIVRTIRALEGGGSSVELIDAQPLHAELIERIQGIEPQPTKVPPEHHPITRFVLNLGETTIGVVQESGRFLSFAGAVTLAFLRQLVSPGRIRPTAIVHHIQETGVNAIPIVATMAFLIGVVLAYQGADQLRQFGAELFTVNLLAVATLRELGVMLTAVMVAGRSGSAFTAQIGTMKVNEELDAMEVIGLDRLDVLVTPRIIALIVALPLLTFLANIMALIGGALVVIFALDIPLVLFLRQLREAVGVDLFIAGMIKAPVFAILIAAIGCYMGLKVGGDAESVGRLTTQSVVAGIFMVIIVNAAFSILFATFGL
jgi:phospholipid/cholesterol/gamma-HCH transport system permease protein